MIKLLNNILNNENKCKQYICTQCGEIYNGVQHAHKSVLTSCTIALLTMAIIIFFLCTVPILGVIAILIALIMSQSNKKNATFCPKCQAENVLVPIDTPKGQKLVEEFYGEEG